MKDIFVCVFSEGALCMCLLWRIILCVSSLKEMCVYLRWRISLHVSVSSMKDNLCVSSMCVSFYNKHFLCFLHEGYFFVCLLWIKYLCVSSVQDIFVRVYFWVSFFCASPLKFFFVCLLQWHYCACRLWGLLCVSFLWRIFVCYLCVFYEEHLSVCRLCRIFVCASSMKDVLCVRVCLLWSKFLCVSSMKDICLCIYEGHFLCMCVFYEIHFCVCLKDISNHFPHILSLIKWFTNERNLAPGCGISK